MKSIIQKPHEVRAILEGRRTQIRVPVKFPKEFNGNRIHHNGQFGLKYSANLDNGEEITLRLHFPAWPGDIIYVREKWQYAADDSGNDTKTTRGDIFGRFLYESMGDRVVKWRSSATMPREAARLFLRITSVRVERLQDISEEDAVAEGVMPMLDLIEFEHTVARWENYAPVGYQTVATAKESFRTLTDLHRPGAWERNEWHWVYTVERIEKPEGWV